MNTFSVPMWICLIGALVFLICTYCEVKTETQTAKVMIEAVGLLGLVSYAVGLLSYLLGGR